MGSVVDRLISAVPIEVTVTHSCIVAFFFKSVSLCSSTSIYCRSIVNVFLTPSESPLAMHMFSLLTISTLDKDAKELCVVNQEICGVYQERGARRLTMYFASSAGDVVLFQSGD